MDSIFSYCWMKYHKVNPATKTKIKKVFVGDELEY